MAFILTFEGAGKSRSLKELKSTLSELPRLNEDIEDFAGDLEALRKRQPSLPEERPWD